MLLVSEPDIRKRVKILHFACKNWSGWETGCLSFPHSIIKAYKINEVVKFMGFMRIIMFKVFKLIMLIWY